MTERHQLSNTPRDRLLEAAKEEMAGFERRELEFRKRDRGIAQRR
jgi:hypothetical protein